MYGKNIIKLKIRNFCHSKLKNNIWKLFQYISRVKQMILLREIILELETNKLEDSKMKSSAKLIQVFLKLYYNRINSNLVLVKKGISKNSCPERKKKLIHTHKRNTCNTRSSSYYCWSLHCQTWKKVFCWFCFVKLEVLEKNWLLHEN